MIKFKTLVVATIVILKISICYGQITFPDSLRKELNNLTTQSKLADLYIEIAVDFSNKNIYDSTIKYLNLALPYYNLNKDQKKLGRIYKELGVAHGTLGNYDSSLYHSEQAIKNYEIVNDTINLASVYGNLGLIYTKKGDFETATGYTLKSLKLSEHVNDLNQIAWASNCLGSIYWYLYDDLKAFEYYNKSLQVYKTLKDTFGIAKANINIAGVFQEQKKYDKAIKSYEEALKSFEKLNEKRGISAVLVNFGSVYYTMKEYEKALFYLKKALEASNELGDKWRSASTLSRMGKCYFQTGRLDESKKYFNQSLIVAKQVDANNIIKDCYKHISEIDSALGDFQSAYNNYKLYSSFKDSLFNIEKSKQISEIQTQYETEQKEKEIELLNKEKEINQNKLLVQKTINYSIIIVLLIFIIGTFLLYRRFKEKQKVNQLLENKNQQIQENQTKIELQNKKLEQQAVKLHELDEIKSRFFTNISHEFRTPLTLIIGPIEQLLTEIKDYKFKNTLNIMLRNAQKLLDLINQLLEISKIEKGSIKLKLQNCNLKDELEYIVQMFSSLAHENQIKLNFSANINNFNGYIDKEKFDKIIINLLSNAFKHTRKGSINIDLKISKTPGKVLITISDTGLGIKKEKLPFIFDRFYQAENNETEETYGTGIGLSYIKELITLYKGSIKAESEEGKGSRFIVELPVSLDYYQQDEYELIEASPKVTASIIKPEENVSLENKSTKQKSQTLLIVEDHFDLRKFIAENLSDNYNIIEASNGEEGINKALQLLPDIIVTDIMMPKISGIELTKRLKNNEKTSHIPIIMLTAKSSDESKIEGLETEADDYLTKPFNIKELKLRIKNLIKIRNKLQEKFKKSITVNPSEITTTSVDEKFLSKLLQAVEEHINDSDFSVEKLSELVGMSRANIHKKLKNLLNQSATEFINSIRLKRAAQLIQQNAGNISEIAYDVGFNNLSYFSRAFKKHFGITPKEMMEQ